MADLVNISSGAVATELSSHDRPEVLEGIQKRFEGVERQEAVDVAETIEFIVTRPRRVAVNEVLVRPTTQEQ